MRKFGQIEVVDFRRFKKRINLLTRCWHTAFFSASVFLGLRFKKEWTKPADHDVVPGDGESFIYVVTFEWLLGIGLIITLAVLAKGVRLSFIKDLLGF